MDLNVLSLTTHENPCGTLTVFMLAIRYFEGPLLQSATDGQERPCGGHFHGHSSHHTDCHTVIFGCHWHFGQQPTASGQLTFIASKTGDLISPGFFANVRQISGTGTGV